VHHLTELYDLGRRAERLLDTGKVEECAVTDPGAFEYALDAAVKEAKAKGETNIVASGKTLQKHGKGGGPNKKDRDWWLVEGPAMVQAYIDWRKLTKWGIAVMPDGQLGVEVRVQVELGGRPVLGYIDRVFLDRQGRIIIVDLKTGKEPTSKLQLGTYAVALLREYGLQADRGALWMGATGELTDLKDMTAYTEEYVDHQFAMAAKGIEAGVFLPNPGNFCGSCGVKDYCRAMGGRLAGSIPVVEVMEPAIADGQGPRQRGVAQVTPE